MDNVVDSAALAASLPADAEGVFLFSVAGGAGGALSARPIEDRGSRISDSITALVAAALRANPDVVGPAVRLRVTAGPQFAFAIEKSVLCPPTAPPSTTVSRISITTTAPPPDRVRSPKYRLRISVDGAVVETELRSSSGVPELDREVMSDVSRFRFEPALLDGKPVEVWLEGGRVEIIR
ncbi:MAG: energy transducer TonB [Gemmatimonadales bacterium]